VTLTVGVLAASPYSLPYEASKQPRTAVALRTENASPSRVGQTSTCVVSEGQHQKNVPATKDAGLLRPSQTKFFLPLVEERKSYKTFRQSATRTLARGRHGGWGQGEATNATAATPKNAGENVLHPRPDRPAGPFSRRSALLPPLLPLGPSSTSPRPAFSTVAEGREDQGGMKISARMEFISASTATAWLLEITVAHLRPVFSLFPGPPLLLPEGGLPLFLKGRECMWSAKNDGAV